MAALKKPRKSLFQKRNAFALAVLTTAQFVINQERSPAFFPIEHFSIGV